jgi:hypothetical protein
LGNRSLRCHLLQIKTGSPLYICTVKSVTCGTGELTQLAVIGLTTERSNSGDLELGLGVSALVYVALDIGMAENEETEAGAGNMAGVCCENW